jgi:hypothetical protein
MFCPLRPLPGGNVALRISMMKNGGFIPSQGGLRVLHLKKDQKEVGFK